MATPQQIRARRAAGVNPFDDASTLNRDVPAPRINIMPNYIRQGEQQPERRPVTPGLSQVPQMDRAAGGVSPAYPVQPQAPAARERMTPELAQQRIDEARYRRYAANQKMTLLQGNSIGMFPNNEARKAAIDEAISADSAAQGAAVRPPSFPSPDDAAGQNALRNKIVAGRQSLRGQLEGLGQGYLDQAESAYKIGDPTKMKGADDLAAEGGRLMRAAPVSFPDLSPAEVESQVAGRRSQAESAAAYQEANRRRALEGRQRFETGIANRQQDATRQRELETLGYENVASGVRANTMENQARGALATASSDPAQIDINRKIQQARLRGELATATGEAAGAERAAATSGFGIDDKLQARVTNNIGALNDAMSDLVTGRVAGNNFGGAEGVLKTVNALDADIANLERAAAQDTTPVTKELADTLINMMPLPGENGEYDSAMFGGNPFLSTAGTMGVGAAASVANARTRSIAAKRMTDLRRRLEKISAR